MIYDHCTDSSKYFFLFLCAISGSLLVEDVNAKILITLILSKLLKNAITHRTDQKRDYKWTVSCSEITCTNISQIEKILIENVPAKMTLHILLNAWSISQMKSVKPLNTNEALFSGPKLPKLSEKTRCTQGNCC